MYINGNYLVTSLPNGGVMKRALRVGENLCPSFPDSIDLKITNSCSEGCSYCHENSVPGGRSFDLQRTISILSSLPRVGIEIAIGGGNVFDCIEDTIKLVEWMLEYGFKPRLTISFKEYLGIKNTLEKMSIFSKPSTSKERLCSVVRYFGVSITKYYEDIFDTLDRIVWHVIVGITPIEEVKKMLDASYGYRRILMLGMKQFGRAKDWIIPDLSEWKSLIEDEIFHTNGKAKIIGFDNLALKQLEIKSLISKTEWNSLWFGPEFSSSMYVDAVEETFAPTSTSTQRTPWTDCTLVDYFKTKKNDFSD